MSSARSRVSPEQVTSAVVAAILLGVAGAIVYLWVQPRQPATLTVELARDVRRTDTQTYITAHVSNSGDETAEAVQVVAELVFEGEVVASGEQVTDFLSGGETEEIVFIFDRASPPDAVPRARVASYMSP